jgi:mannose-6-phosphate isomerase-like protein (cupin superfamily)
MRRPVLLIVCLCALATGLVLLALAQDITGPAVPATRATTDGAAEVDLVRRFYAAANTVLATGDTALLAATVAPDLNEHPTRLGPVSGGDGLVRALLSLRATFPGLTLVVDDLRAAGGDQVLARVHAEGTRTGTFLGRPVPAFFGAWGPLEVWRIEDGRLVERWSYPESAILAPLGQVPISVDMLWPGRNRVTVTRMTAEPGATLAVANGQGLRAFAVESGTLTIEVGARTSGPVAAARASGGSTPVMPTESIAVAAGDLLATPPEADYTIANTGSIPAAAFVVVVSTVADGGSPHSDSSAAPTWSGSAMPEALGGAFRSPPGFAGHILASNVDLAMPTRPILALGWVMLAPGAILALQSGDSPLLAIVDEGVIDPATSGDPAKVLAAGEWTVLPASGGSTWQAGDDAPAAVLVLTVVDGGTMGS